MMVSNKNNWYSPTDMKQFSSLLQSRTCPARTGCVMFHRVTGASQLVWRAMIHLNFYRVWYIVAFARTSIGSLGFCWVTHKFGIWVCPATAGRSTSPSTGRNPTGRSPCFFGIPKGWWSPNGRTWHIINPAMWCIFFIHGHTIKWSCYWWCLWRFNSHVIWVNYNELTTSSLEIIVSKGNHPLLWPNNSG